tara:strand:- start:318 stop:773 length:456 start_codon:yes stop_codon:yes gene_type:complete
MKFILFFILIFIINCSGNKVSNYHGTKSLQSKYDKIQEKTTNKNDIMKLIGPPSTVSDFDKNKWFYFERLKSNQSIFKLGTQKIKKNNILIVKFSENGLVENKQILNLNNMNDLKYFNKETQKEFKNNNVIYNVFSSLREKINAPARNRKK